MAKKMGGLSKTGFKAISAVAIALTLAVIAAGIFMAIRKEQASRPQFITLEKGDNLLIPNQKINYGVNFFPVKYDGTKLGVIAIRDRDGTIRTAFDASELCVGSGKNYFEYDDENGEFVCQNCGKSVPSSQIGFINGEDVCYPYPVTERIRFDTIDSVVIPGESVEAELHLFENWDKYDK